MPPVRNGVPAVVPLCEISSEWQLEGGAQPPSIDTVSAWNWRHAAQVARCALTSGESVMRLAADRDTGVTALVAHSASSAGSSP